MGGADTEHKTIAIHKRISQLTTKSDRLSTLYIIRQYFSLVLFVMQWKVALWSNNTSVAIDFSYSLDQQLKRSCNTVMSQTAQKIRRLEVELESGGNLRYEQGSPSVSWYVIVAPDHLICYLCTGIVAVWTWLTLVYHHMMYWLVRLYYGITFCSTAKKCPTIWTSLLY